MVVTAGPTVAVMCALCLAAASWASSPASSGGATRTAQPPLAATGRGVVTTVDGVVASVDGVVADVVPRTASDDGALVQEGAADFTLAGDVYFDPGSAVLLPRASADLAEVAAQVREADVTSVEVVGHTDTVGSAASNQVLSEDRAASVVAFLQPRLPEVTFSTEGRGETELVATERTEDGEDNPAGRALNRRVTIRPAD